MSEKLEAVVRVRCRWCSGLFGVCRSCYRGQAYCGVTCREAGTRRRQQQARDRHQRTPEGRQDHRDRMRALRARRRQARLSDASRPQASSGATLPAVTDGGSSLQLDCAHPRGATPLRCAAWGCISAYVVDDKPRTQIGRSSPRGRRRQRALPLLRERLSDEKSAVGSGARAR